MNRLLAWLDMRFYRWGERPYSWLMRARGYEPVQLDADGIPTNIDAHADECWFVPDVPSGVGWVRCVPGCDNYKKKGNA